MAEPQGGVQYKWFDIPDNQSIVSVDVSKTPHQAVLREPPRDLVAEKLAELSSRMVNTEAENLMVLGAMAEVYEAVLPFLPPQV